MAKVNVRNTQSKSALLVVHLCCYISRIRGHTSGAELDPHQTRWFVHIHVAVRKVAALFVLGWQVLSHSALRQSLKALALMAPVNGIFLGLSWTTISINTHWRDFCFTFWPYSITFQNCHPKSRNSTLTMVTILIQANFYFIICKTHLATT
jgi:hypothetical protein